MPATSTTPTSPTSFTCPHCDRPIELTQAMNAQLSAELRREYEAHYAPLREKLRGEQAEVEATKKSLAEQAASLDERVRQGIHKEREALLAKAKQQAEEDLRVELTDGKARFEEVKSQLEQSQQAVLEHRKTERELKAQQAKLEADREAMEERVRQNIAQQYEEREKERAGAVQEAYEQKLAEELKARDTEAAALKAKVKEAGERELELLKGKRELEERQETLDLEVQRKLADEAKAIRERTRKEADEENSLKQKEKDVMIEGLRKQTEELRRKLDQGSQQLQGEAQEIALEELLADLFPNDHIGEVPKGINGADALHRVKDPSGAECGSILWESKRTKAWSPGWLPKLRDDQRTAKAHAAIIVTAAMPAEVSHFGRLDGVWVCSWSLISGAATALRSGLITAARHQRAVEGRQTKMEVVYNYLASPEFFNRVSGIIESYQAMQDDLEKEKRAHQLSWAKRYKQLDLALTNAAGMYGDLQGIIGGSTLREIDGISMPMLTADGDGDGDEAEY